MLKALKDSLDVAETSSNASLNLIISRDASGNETGIPIYQPPKSSVTSIATKQRTITPSPQKSPPK